VADEFGGGLIVLDGGACREGIESTIVDCSGEHPTLLRPGTTSRHVIEAALGCALEPPRGRVPRVPGSLASHYAPRAALRLAAGPDLEARLTQALAAGVRARLGVYSRREPSSRGAAVWRQMPDDPGAAAHELFAVLRQFDADGVAQIWVERPPEIPEWDGVRDRLTRASAPS
jgi:L-threonylcarbamoyladenylate synthase